MDTTNNKLETTSFKPWSLPIRHLYFHSARPGRHNLRRAGGPRMTFFPPNFRTVGTWKCPDMCWNKRNSYHFWGVGPDYCLFFGMYLPKNQKKHVSTHLARISFSHIQPKKHPAKMNVAKLNLVLQPLFSDLNQKFREFDPHLPQKKIQLQNTCGTCKIHLLIGSSQWPCSLDSNWIQFLKLQHTHTICTSNCRQSLSSGCLTRYRNIKII